MPIAFCGRKQLELLDDLDMETRAEHVTAVFEWIGKSRQSNRVGGIRVSKRQAGSCLWVSEVSTAGGFRRSS